MSTTPRTQRIEQGLAQQFTHHKHAAYPRLAAALRYAEVQHSAGHEPVPTWRYHQNGHDKSTLDKLFADGLLERIPPITSGLWSERLGNGLIFAPDEKEAIFVTELGILLNHAAANSHIKSIVEQELDLPANTAIQNIRIAFLNHNPVVRIATYRSIIARIESNGLRDAAYHYMWLQWKSACNRWLLSALALQFLAGVP